MDLKTRQTYFVIETLGNMNVVTFSYRGKFYKVDVSKSFEELEEFLREKPGAELLVMNNDKVEYIPYPLVMSVLLEPLEENLYEYFSYLHELNYGEGQEE